MNYFEMYLQICHLSIEFSKEKKLLERKILKCIWKMSIKDFKKYKYDKCGKNFTHNIGLKGHVFHVENISLNQPV